MLIIDVRDSESIDRALKKFKKKFESTKTLKELRRRKHFVKPSVERRSEILKAKFRDIFTIKNEL
ncbi:MAG: 30S ribosomal protein S21 [Saprospiraceae bacterium]|nr:30S ribosomal protein S21 [Saprospiraceae bacterium]